MRAGRALVAASLIAALAGGGSWLGWTAVAQEFAGRIAAWEQAQRAEGLVLAHGAPVLSGFPARWQAALSAPQIGRPGGEGSWRWRGPELHLTWRALDPERVRISAPGAHSFELALARGLAVVSLGARAADAALWRATDGEHLAASFSGAALDARALGFAFEAQSVAVATTRRPDALLAVVAAERLVATSGLDSPLGREVARLDLELELHGPLDLSAPPRAGLEAFQAAGGSLALKRLDLAWGPLRLMAKGTLDLDPELRPRGLLTARVQGLSEAIARFEAAGALPPNRANALKFAAALVTKPNGDGRPEAELPLNLEGGTVFLGPVALVQLRPLY